jgi:predicted nucleic acid-binding protein
VKSVILDTNVFVAAGFNPGSASARIVEQVRAGHLRTSEQLRQQQARGG